MATKAEDVAKAIMTSIKGHTHVHDASHLVVDAKTTGFMFWKTTEIHVSGRVETEREKEVIDKIIETESAGFTVDNKLRVERR